MLEKFLDTTQENEIVSISLQTLVKKKLNKFLLKYFWSIKFNRTFTVRLKCFGGKMFKNKVTLFEKFFW